MKLQDCKQGPMAWIARVRATLALRRDPQTARRLPTCRIALCSPHSSHFDVTPSFALRVSLQLSSRGKNPASMAQPRTQYSSSFRYRNNARYRLLEAVAVAKSCYPSYNSGENPTDGV
jgi:hypothetical protein